MPSRPPAIRQRDLAAYAKAMKAAGIVDWKVVLPDGTQIIASKPGPVAEMSPFDAWKAKVDAR